MSYVPLDDREASDAGAPTDDWLARYRPWLSLIARMQVGSRLQGKFDTSDVVQQTLMEAWRSAAQFRGSTDAERIAWLRKILAHVLAHHIRQYRGTYKRDLQRERSIERSLAQSSRQLDAVLASAATSPSQQAARQEQQVVLAELLNELPADYREVIILRNLEELPHSEVAQRMGRTEGAVRMLWVRALQELRQLAQRRQV
ncbi:MAG: sigma-70 family RNA polymerase sigma factor [Pirellulaceae bacterium]|nr:sigma-70 family RNA polymerase sigma factor [Pirellulaceae bacterium]